MFNSFQHYLSYGSTDQATMRELKDSFNGLIVPGTIAAFQSEGTKGFVLTLSARSKEPYVIDSRFPLFQNKLKKPKKSHQMLAEILGVSHVLLKDGGVTPSDFTKDIIKTIAINWLKFNINFDNVQSKTFDKYAKRLGEKILSEDKERPLFVLPPYLMAKQADDGWAQVSNAIWEATVIEARHVEELGLLRRVIAAESPRVWSELAAQVDDREIVAWVSDLDEFRVGSERDLVDYGEAIKAAAARGQSVFALYGGFLAVLFARFGLTGASHGIGFGEHRNWVELPSSGAPPARFYLSILHRYVSVDIAQILYEQFPDLVACACLECESKSPISLEYHSLMRHSVYARAREIQEWSQLSTADVTGRLLADYRRFNDAVESLNQPQKVIQRLEDNSLHLPMWARILESIEH
ncbi:hypothetical protein [Paeniglutamicibacter kerguelensis]|uniref:Uncharacterized protein n=1 Tax=Paeniglutamicibacter kerguelensis TaxID=254788 RepID=A0ABS4XHI5_9MICC|nr:hypothetical protein [Paeniglutamicibacter kerguelensis]MBP2387934.1 hypothetical protein [Paeniglutamicibacter kerguelensis]